MESEDQMKTREELEAERHRLLAIIGRNRRRYQALQKGARAWRNEALHLRVVALQQQAKIRRSVAMPEIGAPVELDN